MDEINVRDFRKKLSFYLDNPPIAISKRGMVCAYLVKELPVEEKRVHKEEESVHKTLRGFCKGHFEKGVEYDLKKVAYEDVNGAEAEPKWLCPDCIEKMKSEVRRNGGKIIYK